MIKKSLAQQLIIKEITDNQLKISKCTYNHLILCGKNMIKHSKKLLYHINMRR